MAHRVGRLLVVVLAIAAPSAQTPAFYLPEDLSVLPKIVTKIVPGYFGRTFRDPFAAPEGELRVEIVINDAGTVGAARVVRSLNEKHDFEAETIDALRSWRFEPGRKDDRAVPALATVTVLFNQDRAAGRGRSGVLILDPRLSIQGADDEFGKGAVAEGEAGVTSPRKIKDVTPVYPADAQRRLASGAVVLDVVVLEDGSVGRIRVTRPADRSLEAEALRVVKLWQYRPGTRNGQVVAVLIPVTVVFALR
jgi:protein TonB